MIPTALRVHNQLNNILFVKLLSKEAGQQKQSAMLNQQLGKIWQGKHY